MSHIKQIEEKWQKKWDEAKLYEANPNNKKKKENFCDFSLSLHEWALACGSYIYCIKS